MRKNIIVILIMLFISYPAFSQTDKEVSEVLNRYIKDSSVRVNNPFYYREYLSAYYVKRIGGIVKNQYDTLLLGTSDGKQEKFILNKFERGRIVESWNKQLDFPWNEGLADNGLMLTRQKEAMFLSAKNNKDSAAFASAFFQDKTVLEFSRPVFLKNESICVFYCTVTTYLTEPSPVVFGRLVFMRKQNGIWKLYLQKTALTS